MIKETFSPEETFAFGKWIGEKALPGQVYTLVGDLGVGKTVFTQGDIEEMEEIGYDDYFYGNGICLIEWANLIEEILPEQIIEITIEKNLEKGFDYRKITVTGLPE